VFACVAFGGGRNALQEGDPSTNSLQGLARVPMVVVVTGPLWLGPTVLTRSARAISKCSDAFALEQHNLEAGSRKHSA
jgi:hypothetical protein